MDPHSIANGVTRSLQTGNVALDMAISTMICLLLPMITTHLFHFAKHWYHTFMAWLLQDRRARVYRTIATKATRNMYGNLYKNDENHILHKAILLYIQDFKERWQNTAETAEVSLLDTDVNEEDSDSDDEGGGSPSYLETQLKRLSVVTTPVDDVEIEIEPGLFFTRDGGDTNENDGNRDKKENKTETVIITISTERKEGAVEKINDFVDRAYDRYQKSLSSGRKKKKRYMLMMASKSGFKDSDDEKKKKGPALVGPFNKFELSEDKTFDSLFIPQKELLMQLLNDFTHQSGKFGVKGFPRKLGLLLHGPPGTGKTSLIKAIAQHTGRHVVNVSLKRLKTNEQLFNLMYGREFDVIGEDMAMRLPFSKLIFVMEDIDAASEIVKRRSSAGHNDDSSSKRTSPTKTLLEDGHRTADKGPPVVGSLKDDIGPSLVEWLKDDDELDLAGLLNALDGVVDCPGRMVIMTTNHPEKLDPALIRPGRVNMQLHLNYMRAHEGAQMVQHYFGGNIGEQQMQKLELGIPDMIMTPAQLEELCAEKKTVSELLTALQSSNLH